MTEKTGITFGLKVATPVLLVATVLALSVAARPAAATTTGGCIQEVYRLQPGNTQSLTCTANDVKIAAVKHITPVGTESGLLLNGTNSDGSPAYKCVEGSSIHFTADFEVDLGAQARYDIGLYVAQGQASALTGSCNQSIISAENSATYFNLDAPANGGAQPADTCGDISGNLNAPGSHNPQIVHMDIQDKCFGDAVSHKLKLPNCTSWKEKGSNTVCTSINQAIPGAPSKCNCDNNFTVDVGVESPQLLVTKTSNVSPENPLYEPGGPVTFTVHVTNLGNVASVTLTNLTDDVNNDGSTITALALDHCGTTQLKPGESTDCTFTRTVSGNANQQFTDKACVSGTDSNTPPGTMGGCATATVTITGQSPTATVNKSVLPCVVVGYLVTVTNTDTVEPLKLSDLNDSFFGDITKLNSKVVKTTCGLSAASGGPGLLPAVLAANGGTYVCEFNATVCNATTGTSASNTGVLTGTLADDDIDPVTSNYTLVTPSPTSTGTVTINNGTPSSNVTVTLGTL